MEIAEIRHVIRTENAFMTVTTIVPARKVLSAMESNVKMSMSAQPEQMNVMSMPNVQIPSDPIHASAISDTTEMGLFVLRKLTVIRMRPIHVTKMLNV